MGCYQRVFATSAGRRIMLPPPPDITKEFIDVCCKCNTMKWCCITFDGNPFCWECWKAELVKDATENQAPEGE